MERNSAKYLKCKVPYLQAEEINNQDPETFIFVVVYASIYAYNICAYACTRTFAQSSHLLGP